MESANFLAAIRANPYDRAIRLQYADWLMEQGDDQPPRAKAFAEEK